MDKVNRWDKLKRIHYKKYVLSKESIIERMTNIEM